MSKKTLVGFVASLMLASTLSAADYIDATSPIEILKFAKKLGQATLDTDTQGDPKILGKINNTRYGIFFYGCKESKNCQEIQFSTGWKADIALDVINQWNRSKRHGKTYIDKAGDPMIEMTVNLNHGVTKENLEDTFDWWDAVVSQFEQEVISDI